MKKLIVLLTLSTLSTSVLAQETSWFDSLKNLVGLVETSASAMPSAEGLVGMLTSGLGVNNNQASGGMGAIFNYVKNNVSSNEYSQLAKSIPGVSGLVSQMPDISKLSSGSSEGIGGLLNKASEYSDSLKPEMISNFITTAQNYLNTEQGQQAKKLLTAGLGKLLG